jgi:hypothetical protein
MEEKQKCTNCKVSRPLDNFIGKSGSNVRRCLKCREKEQRRLERRPEIKNKKNERQREKKYYIKYRNKKREKNEEEYLKYNAEMAKKWRDNNKEHLSKWKTKNFRVRFGAIKQQAQKKI